MAELVTKDQVIDWFRCYGHMDKPIPYDVLVTDIRAMDSVDAANLQQNDNWAAIAQQWIPVTERMPDAHESLFAHYKDTDKWFDGMFMTISDLVIVCAEYENGERIVKTANTTDGIWKVKDSFYPCRVTHWMPLPELPKEVPENETL